MRHLFLKELTKSTKDLTLTNKSAILTSILTNKATVAWRIPSHLPTPSPIWALQTTTTMPILTTVIVVAQATIIKWHSLTAAQSSYKNNLLFTLLSEPLHQTVNTSPSNSDDNATEQNSPITRVSNKLKTFINSLRPSINALCSTAVTIKTIGNLVSSGNIPQGCTPVCRLGITNP